MEIKEKEYKMLKELCKWLVATAVFAVPAVVCELWLFFGV